MKTKLRYASLTAGAIALAVMLLWLPASPQGSGYNSYQNTIFSTATPATKIRQNTTILYHKIAWTPTGSPAACTVAIDSSIDGTNWSAGDILTGQTCTTAGVSAVTAGQANYVRVNVTALTASKTVTIVYEGWAYNPSGAAAGVTSITATAPITVTPSPLVATGVAACPTCAIGPGSSTTNHLTSFSGTDGVTLADSGAGLPLIVTTAGTGWFFAPSEVIPYGAQVASTAANGVTRVVQFTLHGTYTVRSASVGIQTASSAQTCTVGIYSSTGSKLIDSGTFSTTSAAPTYLTNSFTAVVLQPGVYYSAYACSDATGALSAISTNAPFMNISSSATVSGAIGVHSGQCANGPTAGVLNASCGAITNGAVTTPIVIYAP